MHTHIVTHCLAIWNNYSNALEQKDKDFFDTHVAQALKETDQEFAAAHQLIQKRLEQENYRAEEAIAIAQRLVNEHLITIAEKQLAPIQISTTST